MAMPHSDDMPPPNGNPIPAGTCFRERAGLEAEHLLPALAVAERMLHRGDEEGALRTCAALVLCDPAEPRFQMGLAACALHAGRHAVALRAASAVIAIVPESPEGYHLSGHASLGLRDYGTARDDFAAALRLARGTGNHEIAEDSEHMLRRLAFIRGGVAPAAGGRHTAAVPA